MRGTNVSRCSADSAQRDIADLVKRGLLVPNDKGRRSTIYVFRLAGGLD